MNRRDAIVTLVSFVASLGTLSANAQSPRRVGVLSGRGTQFNRDKRQGVAFVDAMKKLGYQEGRDYVFDDRQWEQGAQVPGLVRELIRLNVDVIVAVTPPAILGAKSVTDRVPIVMVYSADPVATGLVKSLRRPGGNLTGRTWDHGFESSQKFLELLKEMLPNLRRVAVLWDINQPDQQTYFDFHRQAGLQLGVEVISVGARQAADFVQVFETIDRQRADALIVFPSPQLTVPNAKTIMELASARRIAMGVGLGGSVLFADALLLYGPDNSDVPGRVADFVVRILKGAKAGDQPIEQPLKYRLIVNQRIARGLGLTIPQSVLLRADEVIE